MRLKTMLVLCILATVAAFAEEPSEGFLEVDGGKLYYESHGQGPALVLMHDGLVHGEAWDAVEERLVEGHGGQAYRVVRYDRRGYGRSDAATERFVPRQDLVRLLDHLEIPTATLVASSSGGDLAVRFAIAYPSRVERLVLVGAVVSGLGFSDHFIERGKGPMAVQEQGVAAAVEAWKADPYLMAPSSTAAKERFGELLLAHPQNLDHPPGLELGRRAQGHLHEVMAPTLILVGEADHPDVHAHAGALQSGISGARRQVLAGVGHLPYLEAPESFVAAISTFLAEPTESATTLDLRISPCLDLYYYVRTLASHGDRKGFSLDGVAPEIRQAVEAVLELQEDLGTSTLSWGPLDRKLEGCQKVAELAGRLGEFDGSIFLPGRPPVEVGDRAAKIGKALVAAEAVYLREIWSAHREKIEAGKGILEKTLMPKLGKALEYHLRSLGMRDPKATIPVHLLARAPWPGAHTLYRGEGPGGLCFVAVEDLIEDLAGGMLTEIVLHEASHALSILTGGQGSGSGNIVQEVRQQVAELPLPYDDRRRRDISHNLLFVQSGETIRRIVDPNHRHYGDIDGYYDDVPTARRTVAIWMDHLNGALSRRDAIEALVELGRDGDSQPGGD